jgi:hypothetical protein
MRQKQTYQTGAGLPALHPVAGDALAGRTVGLVTGLVYLIQFLTS